MLLPILLVTHAYRIALWKSVPIAVYAATFGTLSTYIWYFVEGGTFGEGVSFYGAVFIMPIAFLLAIFILREKWTDLLDVFAPSICIMLSVMKMGCFLTGCCAGRELFVNADGVAVCFPSQLAELANALILMIVLLVMAFRKKRRGKLYPWFMVLYGITRFVLNFFRAEYAESIGWFPPFGTIWSLVSVVVGGIWLFWLAKKDGRGTSTAKDSLESD